VHGRFHDSSISVREASIDLVGRFLSVQRDLTAQYYPMLAERILVSQQCCCLNIVYLHLTGSNLLYCSLQLLRF